MCGLVFAVSKYPAADFVRHGHRRQFHRGPDSGGLFEGFSDSLYFGMAHQRLAIVDLSENGAQPMLSHSKRIRIVFNGEIYNYKELAARYGLSSSQPLCDTRIAVELIERLGIRSASEQFNGMWAIIVHDLATGTFHISRDRFGKKPLYYFSDSEGTYFASEMHTLLSLPKVDVVPNVLVASRFLTQSLQSIDEHSWIDGIKSFPAGEIAEINPSNISIGVHNFQKFWTRPDLDTGISRDFSSVVLSLKNVVSESINLRLSADVPVGVALSGGLDSSIISAVATKSAAVSLFSAVSPGSDGDESEHIDVMERYLGINVNRFELNVADESKLLELLCKCISHSDGPVSSFSSLLFYKLMEAAKSLGVKVVLTGQGADEGFCGYRKYPVLEAKRLISERKYLEAFKFLRSFRDGGFSLSNVSFAEAKRYLGFSNKSVLGRRVVEVAQLESLSQILTLSDRQWLDVTKYSVPYLCHYEDRMSMALSQEVRAPFLDYRVIEMGLAMSTKLKLQNGWTKYALRLAFDSELPSAIAWRKDKKGFSSPQDYWLKVILKNSVLDIMSSTVANVYEFELVNRSGYLKLLNSYISGDRSVWFRDVFAPFSLELWLREVKKISSSFRAANQI